MDVSIHVRPSAPCDLSPSVLTAFLSFLCFLYLPSHLRHVDKFNEHLVSAFITPGGVRFLILHELRHNDAIRHLFNDVYTLFVKLVLNPFFSPGARIESPVFDAKVKALVARYIH